MRILEWVNILNDLDSYIERGGQLGDLPLGDTLPPEMVADLARDHLKPSTAERLSRFFGEIGARAGNKTVGDTLNERTLREIWRATANA